MNLTLHAPLRQLAVALLLASGAAAQAETTSVLFVGNSYTFGRVDPVMSYNTANVRDLTQAMFNTNPQGSNVFEPHPWGGVPGIFQRLTVQAGLDYDVAMSTRNAASLRGHLLNTNPAGWDLRGNIGGQVWDQVVLQEQSDEILARRAGLASNPEYARLYLDLIEDWVHQGTGFQYREWNFIGGSNAECQALGYSGCNTLRTLPTNTNASAATEIFLYQSWARQNLVDGAFITLTDPITGAVTRTETPATTFFPNLEAMTDELRIAYAAAVAAAGADGSGGYAGIAPVGQSFMRAVAEGIATRNLYAPDAQTDGLIDLWFDDGTHASKWGSYLSALTLFGTLTGQDPSQFGGAELAAFELGISPTEALALQRIAAMELGFTPPVPEPAALWLALAGLGAVVLRTRRRVAPAA